MNEPLHPQTSAPRQETLTPVEAVDRFATEIAQPDFLTWDYGDWMRRVNNELSHLRNILKDEHPKVQAKLDHIRDFVQLEPNWDIMNTLRKTVRELIILREELGAKDSKTLADYGISTSEQDPSFVTH